MSVFSRSTALAWVTLFLVSVASAQTTCSKFAGQASKVVTVGSTCYYGFSSTEYWDDAQSRCESQGTHLVHLQTITKQKDVYAALGSDFSQHWMGLVYLNSEWEWYTNTQNTVSAIKDVDTRWEGGSSGECAYTTSSSNQWVLKATQRKSWYRAVCEDETSSEGSQTDISLSTYLTTVPPQSSSATVALAQTTCSKFAGQASKVVTVGSTCYYGFSSTEYWDDAQNRCESQGTYLVHLQTITKQKDVYAALGSDFTQHWMGLVYLNSEWEWYTNTQNTVSAIKDVDTRWEGGSSGECAYTTSSSNQWVLKATQRKSWYRAVCEDETSSEGSQTDISLSTYLTTVPPQSSSATVASAQTTCSKFAGQASKVVTVGSTCYYGFSSTEYWDDAQNRCESQGTHLVHLQTITKQKDVYAALGSDFTQHWMGLVYLNSEWEWYTNTQNTVSAIKDVDTRWEGGSSGECAYTTSSSNQWVLKATQRKSWYRAVCEDGTSSEGSQTDISLSTYLTTVPPQSSSATVASAQTTCSKFAGQASKVVTVGSTCYYGFSSTEYWDDAQNRCESQGTHLVHLQTITKQKDVYAALGSDFTQHWMGLVYLNSEWEWYTNTQNTVSAIKDVDTRWEGGSSGECAYTTSSSNQWVLKATQRMSWYRAVCEDETSSEASTMKSTDSTTTAIMVSTATQSFTLSTTAGSTESTSIQKSTVSTTVGSTVPTSTQKSTVTTSVGSTASSSTQTSTVSTAETSLQSLQGSKTTYSAASTLNSASSSVDSSPSTIDSTAPTQKLTVSMVDSKVSTTNSFTNSLDSFVYAQTSPASTSDSTFFTVNTTASSVYSARSTLNSSASAADRNTSTDVTTTITTESSTNPRGSTNDTYMDT